MSVDKSIDRFIHHLDGLLGLGPREIASTGAEAAIQVASLLIGMDFENEAIPRPGLRDRWTRQVRRLGRHRPARIRFSPRLTWIAAAVLMLSLLVVFHQPVLAAVERLFGYIYIPNEGFLAINTTQLLAQPVVQEHDGDSLTVTQGFATPQETTLLLEFGGLAQPGDGIILVTSPDEHLEVSYWEFFPNVPGSHGVKLVFPTLPAGTAHTTLVLPAGWHLPLDWIPAAQSQLPDVRAVPYIVPGQGTSPAPDLCVEKNGIKLCLKATSTGAENTSVLVEAAATNPALIPAVGDGLMWQSETELVTLRDEQGNVYSMDNQRPPLAGTLIFPPVPGTHELTLTIPALRAEVDIPDQTIRVDMGDDPGPGTVIPLDASIQVLGATIHFSQATFVGDGVSSLRLILNADEPVQMVDGITPDRLEIGRPDRVDDLYGDGDFGGSQDIHVELIHGNVMVTGKIELPVVRATVIVQGPFEFTFHLSDLPAITPTPLVADPNSFSPAPTSTPIALDSYSYTGQTLQSGDLLYAVWNGEQSDIFRYNPAQGQTPVLLMTLPGNVSSLHLHTDRRGLDYLAGNFNPDTGMENTALYTLRFDDPRPRPLRLLTPGGITWPSWSYDGRLLAFDFQLQEPGEFQSRLGWVDMDCRDTGECPVRILDAPAEYRLGLPKFSPQGYWLAMTGADVTYGAGEIYLLDFDEEAQPGELQNFTRTGLTDDSNADWVTGNSLAWKCIDESAQGPAYDQPAICLQDIAPGNLPQIFFGFDDYFLFELSSRGNYFWHFAIDRTVQNGLQLWLHDRQGNDRLLIEAPVIDMDYGKPAFSDDEHLLAYMTSDKVKAIPDTLHIVTTSTGQELSTFEGLNPIGWLEWVP